MVGMKRTAVFFAALLLVASVPAGEIRAQETPRAVSEVRTVRTNYWKKERLGYFVRVDENGKIIRTEGFYPFDGSTFFLCGNSGRRVQGWLTYKGATYYFDPQTGAQAFGYQVIDGVPYYFDPGSSPAGRRRTGSVFIDGKRYYFTYKNGNLVTGWINGGTNGGNRYYIAGDGAMKSGWTRIVAENRTYYFDPGWGYALKGLQTIDGKKYLFVEGTSAVGRRWVSYRGDRYYCDPKTAVVTTGTAVIDGREYHFDDTGRLIVTSPKPEKEWIAWNPSWPYADYSRIHTGRAVLTRPVKGNGIVICVNAGHGTEGGESVRTLCHPDGSAKVTDGSTGDGAVYAIAGSSGTTMLDGTDEGTVNLQMALILRDRLLKEGFGVLMIRETGDVQLDNIARTVMANQNADCHVAVHYDSTEWDKGFYCSVVPESVSYRSMEPVASHWRQHDALARAIVQGVRGSGCRIFGDGTHELDLTQTSYSTIPSVDIECGDCASDWSKGAQEIIAGGIVRGIKAYFGK